MSGRSGRLPNLAIIGAQKSATSFVQHCLAAHPDVFLVRSEVAFFEDELYAPSRLGDVARLLPARRRDARYFGIKRPDYLARPNVAERLAAHLPDARLIAVLRDPIERLVSAYYHFVRYSLLPDLPLDEGVRAALDAAPTDAFSPQRALLTYGEYATALERYREHFAPERIKVFLHEDVTGDPQRCYRELLEFLELRPWSEGVPFGRRQNPGVYDRRRIRFLRLVQKLSSRVDPARNHWSFRFGPFGMAIYFAARQIDKKILARVFTDRAASLDPALRARLAEYYADDIARLERLLDRDLGAWKTTQRG